MTTETIAWHRPAERLPDDKVIVLIHVPESGEPIWLGFHEAGNWYWVSGWPIAPVSVVAWAARPAGLGDEVEIQEELT